MAHNITTYSRNIESRLIDPRRLSNKRKYDNYKNDIDYVELDSNTKKRQYSSMIDPFNSNNDSYIGNSNPFIGTNDPFIGTNDPFIGTNDPFIGSSNTFNTNMNPHHFTTNQFNENMASYYKSNQVLRDIIEKQTCQITFLESQQDKMKSIENRIDELYDKNKILDDKNKILEEEADKFEITRSNFNEDYKFCKFKFKKLLTKMHNIFQKYPSLYQISREDNIIVIGEMDGYNYDKNKEFINGTHIAVSMTINKNLYVYNQFLLHYNSNIGLDTDIKNWDKVRVFCPRRISFSKNLKIGHTVKLKIFTNTNGGKRDSTIGELIFDNQ
jgi:hypothetical protein